MWKDFRKKRIQVLNNAIKENKIDEKIVGLIEKINENPNLVVTSSCFGRVVLLEFDIMKTKKTSIFYRKWHRRVNSEEVELAVSQYGGKLPLWFMVEPFMLHVSAKDMKSTADFMTKIRKTGIRTAGIHEVRKDRVTMEVQGTSSMSVPASIFEGSWDELIKIANRLMDLNETEIRKLLRVER